MSSTTLVVLLSVPAAISAVVAVTAYVLYLKARLTDRGHPDEPRFDELQLAELDRREQRYLSIHYISLFLFFLLGIAILATISYRTDQAIRHSEY